MNTKSFTAICFILIGSLSISAQVITKDTYPKNQITFGIGIANGFESHIFNVQEDKAVRTALAMNLSYLHFINKNIGLGGRAHGYTKTIKDLILTDGQGRIYNPKFTLVSVNLCAEGVYLFSQKKFQPYVCLLLGYTIGEVSSDETGNLEHYGFAVGGGVGARYAFKSWAISLEFSGLAGKSNWSETPFLNSTSRDFDPSMISIILGISSFWGRGK